MQARPLHGTPPARGGAVILLLASLTAITPLATDMLLPAFPDMGHDLHAADSSVQLSLTAYLLGMLVGQLLIGPVSDSTGRRRLLLWGSALFAVFSVLCAVATSTELLNTARVLEGVSGSAGMVLARAVVGDWYRGQEAAKRFSILSVIFAVAPIIAPVLGGLITNVFSWRALFVVLAALSVVLLIAVAVALPESLPPERRHSGGVATAFRSMRSLLAERSFLGYVLVFSFANVALFSYISGSSFVFQDVYKLSATQYSLSFAVTAVGILIGGAMVGNLAAKAGLNRLLTIGVTVGLAASAGHAIVSVTAGNTLTTSLVFMFLCMFAMGLTIPSIMTIGQEIGRRSGGAASGVIGAGQCLFGGIAAPVVGALGTGSDKPMAALMVIGFGCAFLCLVLIARPWQRHGENTVIGGQAPQGAATVH
ncbi:MFS transporter, DHA1 family, bicyclomycin/chloramphenicol resistance protein [Streptomyces misionensis]|uniref:MFS transporter, DHA1 family, bicyclomycin/chloramphenicol resistance protein n=1 Tax=Streptomyces misionensis TaxID=67331 RepID=A0A1H5C6M9_9ACTN|nr:multidrug effflux MFS transporter [Streptomyces misionensis]SED62276.1 MFS transporter, DHA1 family, bicyclomycin/chloramphenicol resistance protein [Streptomyces misionensis]